MAEAKLKPVPNRYNETAIEAIETFDIKLEQARAVIRVLASAHTDPSGRPTQKTTAFGLQAASALIDEAQRIIEPVIRRVSLRASAAAPVIVRPSAAPAAPSESHQPPDAA